MRTILLSLCVFSLTLLPAISLGNGPPLPAALRYTRQPDKKKDDDKAAHKEVRLHENAPIALTYRHDLKRAAMYIPQKFAIVDGKPADAPKKAAIDPPASRNLCAGLALSAAFVSGGFWLVRRSGKALVVVAILGSITFLSIFLADVTGNAGPPRVRQTTRWDVKDNTATLGMDVYIVAEGDRIQLVLPKDLLPALMIPQEEFNKHPLDPTRELFPKKEAPKKGDE